jgi:hypothetical protein
MSTVVQAAEDAAKAAGSDPNRGVEAEGNGSNAKMSEWRGASSVLLLYWFDRHLHLYQPFFLQFSSQKWAFLLLIFGGSCRRAAGSFEIRKSGRLPL